MSLGSATSARSSGPGGGSAPQYWTVFANALSALECAQLTAVFEASKATDGGLVAGRFDQKVRQSALVWLPERADLAWVDTRLARLTADANRELFGFALDGFEEQLQVAAYGPGHYYDWHIDRGQGSTAGRRKLTISVQLSKPEDYVGGTLELNADGRIFQAPCDQGTAVVFAANTLHRVAPVVSGLRHSLVAWLHGPNFA